MARSFCPPKSIYESFSGVRNRKLQKERPRGRIYDSSSRLNSEDPEFTFKDGYVVHHTVEHDGSQRVKPGFKKYACDLTWDPDTAHKNLLLSEGNKKVTWVKDEQPYPPHLERFDLCQQVLCEQGLDKRCYWEVDVEEPFNIGLTYRSIGRKGDGRDCKLGRNDKSWCLMCSDEGCFVQHSNKKVDVSSLCSRSSRLGLYLDWPAGTLTFYRVSSDSRTCLHTFKTTFIEPLCPAVELHTHASAVFVS